MNTPICDFLEEYAEKNTLRMHMPGHKGIYNTGFISQSVFKYDITEIKNADSLFEADGIIMESEKIASELFKTKKTLFSVQGSTLAIQTMLGLMKSENRKVIASRNSHRAFLNACALLDLETEWIYPEYKFGIVSGKIKTEDIENALERNSGQPLCVYITSPDYLGGIADIKSISEICRKYDAPLLVDNAHGACTSFFEKSMHPIHLGADMCCDSAHKTLPALTGTAYLHIANEKYCENAKLMMSVFASTSPSYILLSSLDWCNSYIKNNIKKDLQRVIFEIKNLKASLSYKYDFADGEPLHISITGIDGNNMAERLREYNIECEYADFNCIVLLCSPVNSHEDFEKLKNALSEINPIRKFYNEKIVFPEPERAMSLRKAFFSPSELIDVEQAEGRICSSLNVPCPPAIPINVSGEIISAECIEIYRKYNIRKVNVVKCLT